MPELPEVETMRRGILGIIGGKITKAERAPCAKKQISIRPRIDSLNRRVSGKKIVSADRLGKRVVLRLDSEDRLVFEPRMTGLVLISEPPTREHLRFQLTLSRCPIKRLWFWDRRGLGNVTLFSDAEYQAKLSDGTLGPDALEIQPDQLAGRFRGTRREIKVALLDQSAIAGIGNLYASEILHLAKIDPRARCDRLTRKQWQEIHRCLRQVLLIAIEYEGSTLSDGTYRNALNQSGNYQNEHVVYDRAEEICRTCQATNIQRIVQAQRATFFCPKCQRKR